MGWVSILGQGDFGSGRTMWCNQGTRAMRVGEESGSTSPWDPEPRGPVEAARSGQDAAPCPDPSQLWGALLGPSGADRRLSSSPGWRGRAAPLRQALDSRRRITLDAAGSRAMDWRGDPRKGEEPCGCHHPGVQRCPRGVWSDVWSGPPPQVCASAGAQGLGQEASFPLQFRALWLLF